MLIFPAEFPDRCLASSFHDWNAQRFSADSAAVLLALFMGNVEQGLIGYGLDEAVTEKIERHMKRSNLFRLRHTLLNLSIRETRIGTNGPIIDQRAAFYDLLSMRDGNFGILEMAVRYQDGPRAKR